jgi:hypothetical protein
MNIHSRRKKRMEVAGSQAHAVSLLLHHPDEIRICLQHGLLRSWACGDPRHGTPAVRR